MSEPEEILPGPLERAFRRAIETESETEGADRQRRRTAVLSRVAALDAAQRQERMSGKAANRPLWLMLGGSALALVLSAGLVWQLSPDREPEPLAGVAEDGVKLAAAPTSPPPAREVALSPQARQPAVAKPPPGSAALPTDASAKAARIQAPELRAAAPPAAPPAVPPLADAAPAGAAPADAAVAEAASPALPVKRERAQPPAAPVAALRQRPEAMATPSGAAALQAPAEPIWVAQIRDDDRAGLRAALDAGLEVDATDALGRTPLMHAAILGRPEIIDELLARSASRTRVDRLGQTAVQYAAGSPDPRVRARLLESR